MRRRLLLFVLGLSFPLLAAKKPATTEPDGEASLPHTPTLLFQLTGASSKDDADAIQASVGKLKSVKKIVVDTTHSSVQVRFDSHVVSFHQVAQAISDAGNALGKKYDPRLTLIVPEYAQPGNAAKVDAIFAGKRLNQRVRIEPADKTKGIFTVHFLPLQADPNATGPQGFNGGHLHHPIHDPAPRGLGLNCDYASGEDKAAP